MSTIARNQNWVDGEVLFADVLDGQFDKIYDLLNGTDAVNGIVLGAVTPQNPNAKLTVGGQVVIQSPDNGAVLRSFNLSDLGTPMIDISNLGWIKLRAGSAGTTPSAQQMYASGCLYNKSNNIGNVGAGEDDLHTFVIGANTVGLGGGESHIRIRAYGYVAANANNKRIKFYCKTTVIADTGIIVENNVPWYLEADVMLDSDGVSTLTIAGKLVCGATEIRFNVQETGYDPTVNNTWKWTAEAVANNDVVQNMFVIDVGRGLN